MSWIQANHFYREAATIGYPLSGISSIQGRNNEIMQGLSLRNVIGNLLWNPYSLLEEWAVPYNFHAAAKYKRWPAVKSSSHFSLSRLQKNNRTPHSVKMKFVSRALFCFFSFVPSTFFFYCALFFSQSLLFDTLHY